MKSLADIFRDLFHHHYAHDYGSRGPHPYESRRPREDQESPYLLLSQKPGHHQAPATPASPTPSRKEILDYLGQLADQYDLPRKLVYGVADAESSLTPDLVSPNYKRDRHHNIVHDEHGNPVVKSKDYGLMQINSPRIGHDFVRDANGHRFKIEENVIHDWKANARAGVAIIKHAHDVITLSEGPGASSEDIALGTYSYYNHDHSWHKFLERDKHGVPKDGAVRNFYNKYRISPNR